jgi:hypothetical protein
MKARKVNKKSKRLEFTPSVIRKFSDKAKKHGKVFKTYAEQLIIDEALKK